MKMFTEYAQYSFLVALFLFSIPLISSDADYNQDSVVMEDNAVDSITVTPAEPTIAWYRRPRVKNIVIGSTIVAMGGYIVLQKIIIDKLVRIAQEAVSEHKKTLAIAQEAVAIAQEAFSEYEKALAIAPRDVNDVGAPVEKVVPIAKDAGDYTLAWGVLGCFVLAVLGNWNHPGW